MMEAGLAFLFGLLIGSFLNVCIYRVPRDLSVVRPRSFCPACEHQISWYDNVPVLSFVLLGRRCRYCRHPISWRYPLVELATGLLFAWSVYQMGPSLAAVKGCVFSAILVALIVTDAETMILPDELTLGGAVVGFALAWLVPMDAMLAHLVAPGARDPRLLSLIEAALGAGVTGGCLLGLAKAYKLVRHREGMGLGDVKMMVFAGSFLGLQSALLVMMIGSLLGSVAGVVQIGVSFIAAGRRSWPLSRRVAVAKYIFSRRQLPFGAFLGASAILVALFGEAIFHWYLRLGT